MDINVVASTLANLAVQYPWVMAIVVVMGVFRAIFKPIMTVVEKYVEATPSKSDDAFLAKIKESKVYRAVAWFADYLLSVKLPKKESK